MEIENQESIEGKLIEDNQGSSKNGEVIEVEVDLNHLENEIEEQKPKRPRKKSIYSCDIDGCGAIFGKWVRLVEHSYKHTGIKPFVCNVKGCSKSYTSDSHLRRHILSHSATRQQVSCNECPKTFSSKQVLNKHCKLKHNPERKFPFLCPHCNEGFSKKSQLNKHSTQHTGIDFYVCNKCELRFKTSAALNQHLGNHRVYTCECSKTFDRFCDLNKHKRTSHKKEFICEECKEKFLQISNYKMHLETHKLPDERNVFKCTFEGCNRTYYYKKNLDYHIKHCHNKVPRRRFECPMENCNSSHISNFKLQAHLKKHSSTVEKKVVVRRARNDIGSYHRSIIADLAGVNLPEKVHTNLLKRTTNVKSKVADEDSNILPLGNDTVDLPKINEKQLETPDEGNIFKCTFAECDRFYLYKRNLNYHIKYDHNKEPKPKLECSFENCNHSYRTKYQLQLHLKSHTGEKVVRKAKMDKVTSEKIDLETSNIEIKVADEESKINQLVKVC